MKTFTPRADRSVALLFVLAAFLLTMCAPILASAQTIDQSDTCEVLVTRVVDGDTFFCVPIDSTGDVRDTVKVRVLNLDTYEKIRGERLEKQAERMNITSERALFIGKLAKEYSIDKLQGQVVTLHRGSRKAPNYDKYGRLLRCVILDNGKDFSEVMKEQGFNVKR